MKSEITAVIAHSGENLNGREYTTESLQRMVSRINESPVYVTLGQGYLPSVDLTKVVGTLRHAYLNVVDGRTEVSAQFHLLEVPLANEVLQLLVNKIALAIIPDGRAVLDESGTIHDYRLSCASLIPAEDSAFPHTRIFGVVHLEVPERLSNGPTTY